MRIPHTLPGQWPADVAAGRFAATIKRVSLLGCQIALVGLADDTGVRLNRGRPGAKDGPRAFRAALARYGVATPASGALPRVFDAGDVQPGRTLEETHARVSAAVAAILNAGLLPVAIGGGHDLTYPFVRAVAARHPRMEGVYFDAHLDVRENRGSGMSFRRLVTECGIRALHLHGYRPLVNSLEHFQAFRTLGGRIYPDGHPARLPRARALFASLDLDVIDAAHAPGVSAPNPAGWTVNETAAWVRACGASTSVRCFDLMELNPAHDDDGRTARVAAHLFLSFLQGYTER